jgi:hypothetical protein
MVQIGVVVVAGGLEIRVLGFSSGAEVNVMIFA